MDDLCFFLSDLKAGRLPTALKPFLLHVSLLALLKKNGEPRPVAVGELFYRLVTSWAMKNARDPVSQILAPIQMGLGVPGGVETVHLFLQALLGDERLGFVAIATDFTNAFNSRGRDKLLSAIFRQDSLRSLWNLAH